MFHFVSIVNVFGFITHMNEILLFLILFILEDTESISLNDNNNKENKQIHTPVKLVFSDPGAIGGKFLSFI